MRTRPDSGKDIGEVRDRQTIGQVTEERVGQGTRHLNSNSNSNRKVETRWLWSTKTLTLVDKNQNPIQNMSLSKYQTQII